MWTANILSKAYSAGQINVGVVFSNGTDSFTAPFAVGEGDLYLLSERIKAQLTRLNGLDSLASQIAVGPYSPASKPVPSARETFAADLVKLRGAKRAVELGIIQSTDPIYTSALSAAQASFSSSFLDML